MRPGQVGVRPRFRDDGRRAVPRRAEIYGWTATGTWILEFWGLKPMRGLVRLERDTPRLVFAGSPFNGLVEGREGREFEFSTGQTEMHLREVGGGWILRSRAALGARRRWNEITITQEPVRRAILDPILVLWGGLNILQASRFAVTTLGVSWTRARAALDDLIHLLEPDRS